MKQYYYKAGVFPHNCSNSSFEDDVSENYLGNPYDTSEKALAACKNLGFRRVFEMDDDGSWKAVAGYAPNGSLINDADWEHLSKLTLKLVSKIPDQILTDFLTKEAFRI